MTWKVDWVGGDHYLVSKTLGDRVFFQDEKAVYEYLDGPSGLEIRGKHPPDYDPECPS